MYSKQFDRKFTDGNNLLLVSSPNDDTSMHVEDRIPLKRISPIGHRDVSSLDTSKDSRFGEGVQQVPSKPNNELTLNVGDLDIPWSDLVLKEKIGAGILPSCLFIMWRTNMKVI